jgi:hypothetical protein
MTKAVWSAITTAAVTVVFSALSATTAYAQATAPGTVNVQVNVAAKAKLTLGSASLVFLSVDVKARTAPAGSVTLTVLASGDLVNGTANIAVTNLAWTTLGAGFVAGASNKTTAQSVGSWTGSGTRTGSQIYTLPNSWAYATGTYSVTLNYTLTAP